MSLALTRCLRRLSFDAIPLPDAVNALALQAGLNIQFDPKLLNTVGPDGRPIPVTPPTISAKWKKLTAKQALTALLDNWGWQLVMDPSSPIGRITAKDPTALEPLVTTVIELEYSDTDQYHYRGSTHVVHPQFDHQRPAHPQIGHPDN